MKKIIILFSLILVSYFSYTQCTAQFSASQDSVGIVEFIDVSNPSTGTIVLWSWDFGDGNSTTTQLSSYTHFYISNGVYNVCMTITTDDSCSSTYCDSVFVTGIDPCAGFNVNLTVTDASAQGVADGAIQTNVTGGASPYTYQWSNGENTGDISSLSEGYYCVVVTDANSCEVNICDDVLADSCVGPVIYPGTSLNPSNPVAADGLINPYVTGGTYPYTYQWSNGETTADLTNLVAGVYCLTVTDFNGCTGDSCFELIADTLPCNADFDVLLLDSAGYTFFADNSTPQLYIISWYWDFGGSGTSNDQNPVYAFPENGLYLVCLTITTSDSCTSSFCDSIIVDFVPDPCAGFSADLTIANASAQGVADGAIYTSVTGGTAPYSYIWLPLYDSTANLIGFPSDYYCVTVTDSEGCNITLCDSIGIEPLSCNAVFSAILDTNATPYTYQFTDQTVGGVLNWYYDFGDGTSSTEQNPVHTFPGPGTYLISLTVNSCGYAFFDSVVVEPVSGSCQADFQLVMSVPDPYGFEFVDLSSADSQIISWHWDHGDGDTSSVQYAEHTYANPGYYYVCLTIETNDNCTSTYCDTLVVDPILGSCQASYYFDTDTIITTDTSGTDIVFEYSFFNNSSYYSPYPYTTTYEWDFGDGNSSILENPVNSYYQSGTYQICLTIEVTDSVYGLCTSTYCDTIVVDLFPECATAFTIDSTSLNCGPNCFLFLDASIGDTITDWAWDFGDGTTSTETNPVHTFLNSGSYNVCLTTTTSTGCSSTYCETLVFTGSVDCQASFNAQQAWCGQNCYVFTDNSSANSNIISWFWDFGDGTTSNEQNPEHIFVVDTGYYDVCLTIVTDDSCSSTYCDQIYANSSYCHAEYTWTQVQGVDCICALITNTSTYSMAGSEVTYTWDSGNGPVENSMPAYEVTYPGYGSFPLCLTITVVDSISGDTCTDTYCDTIMVVPDTSCTASFGYTQPIQEGNPHSFISAPSYQDTITSWTWYIEGNIEATGQQMDYVFQTPGAYNVCLEIVTSSGCTDIYCDTIIKQPIPCPAEFDIIPAYCPNCFGFIDQTQEIVEEWNWDFGDGDTSNVQHPTHTYADSGYYEVCLTTSWMVNPTTPYSCTICDTLYAAYSNTVTYSISGNVHQGGSMLQDGVVILFYNTGDYYSPIQFLTVSNGAFTFENLQVGTYIIYAIPDPSVIQEYMPTFYVNKLAWSDADEIAVTGDVYDIDIYLQDVIAPAVGGNSITGSIIYNDPATYESYIYDVDWFGSNKKLKSNYARNTTVSIYNNDTGNPVDWALSDENGYFAFHNLPEGDYLLDVQKPGLTMTDQPVINVVEGTNNPAITVTLQTNDIIFGIPDMSDNSLISDLRIFPNPVLHKLNITIDIKEKTEISFRLSNTLGQEVYSSTVSLNQGSNNFELDVSDLSSGIYIGTINAGTSATNFKIVK